MKINRKLFWHCVGTHCSYNLSQKTSTSKRVILVLEAKHLLPNVLSSFKEAKCLLLKRVVLVLEAKRLLPNVSLLFRGKMSTSKHAIGVLEAKCLLPNVSSLFQRQMYTSKHVVIISEAKCLLPNMSTSFQRQNAANVGLTISCTTLLFRPICFIILKTSSISLSNVISYS